MMLHALGQVYEPFCVMDGGPQKNQKGVNDESETNVEGPRNVHTIALAAITEQISHAIEQKLLHGLAYPVYAIYVAFLFAQM